MRTVAVIFLSFLSSFLRVTKKEKKSASVEVSLRWFGHISGFSDAQFKDVSTLLLSFYDERSFVDVKRRVEG